MAEKEATIFIVDVGRPMGEKHLDRSMTDLEWSMQYVWDRITTAVSKNLFRDAFINFNVTYKNYQMLQIFRRIINKCD